MKIVAIDGVKKEWIAACLQEAPCLRRFKTLEQAHECYGDAMYYVDTPIGLTDSSLRIADSRAREYAPTSTVFNAPGLSLVQEYSRNPGITHAEANRCHGSCYGDGISIQTFGLLSKIVEARELQVVHGSSVREYHPEVAAVGLGGSRLYGCYSKSMLLGALARLRLLSQRLKEAQLEEILISTCITDAVDAALGAAMGLLIEEEPERAVTLGNSEDEGMIWAWGLPADPKAVKRLSKVLDTDVQQLIGMLSSEARG